MKTIYLKIEVSDGYKATAIDCQSNENEDVRIYEHQITELHLPTNEEIYNYAKNVYSDCGQKTLNIQRKAFRKALTAGANFVINKLLAQ